MTNIIRDLKEVDIEINLQYRNSKLPKFIKKIISKFKRHRLYTLVDTVGKTDKIPVELLHEYCQVLYDTYPPFGRYRGCNKVTKNNDGFIVTFMYFLDQEKIAIMMINMAESLHENEDRIIIIRYTFMNKGKTKFSYGESVKYIDFIARAEDTNNDISRANLADQKKIIKNYCIDSLHDDIVCFLKDIIERSERVYKV